MTEILRSRKHVLSNVLRVLIHRYLKRLARGHVAANDPPVAVYAFDIIGTAIMLFGRFERDELDVLSFWLAEQRLEGACVDIGANVGNHALFFSQRFSKVFAFEPNPQTFKLLQINATLAQNIRCFDVGLSDHEGNLPFFLPTIINTGVGHIASGRERKAPSASIRVVPLDAINEISSERVAIMKIDVEGHELQVLKGAQKLISRDRPVVLFEQGHRAFSQGTSPAIEFLRTLGYARFLTMEKSPQFGNPFVTAVARLLCGERIALREVGTFERKVYPIIVALPH